MAEGRWTTGKSIGGIGKFKKQYAQPVGEVPVLRAPDKEGHEQTEELTGAGKSFLDKAADFIIGD